MNQTIHIAVMTREVIEALQPRAGGRYIDGTLGGATHTEELLKASAPSGRVVSLDVDLKALERARWRLASYGERWRGIESNFRDIAAVAQAQSFAPCDGILLDLGFSSDELADAEHGLSFQVDGPLDMRLGPQANVDGLKAEDIVNSWSAGEIETILREYGEERYARRIAETLVERRRRDRFTSTKDLAAVIAAAVPKGYEHGRLHPATRSFQALRIAVNDELETLKQAIEGARSVLAEGGRIVIISFHSLEDRIVKQAFKQADDLQIITKRPLCASEEEIKNNPRARSAKVRIAEKNKHQYVTHVRHRYDSSA